MNYTKESRVRQSLPVKYKKESTVESRVNKFTCEAIGRWLYKAHIKRESLEKLTCEAQGREQG